MATFLEIATPLAERGIPVIPVQPNDKPCFLLDWAVKATTSLAQIGKWNAENCAYNVGCVAKPEGIVVLDCDVKQLDQRIERETGQKFPHTLIVKSAGKGCLHFYFLQTEQSRKIGNQKRAGLFDLQSDDKYVVGPGSRLANGNTYDIMQDVPIAPIPDSLVDWIFKNADAPKKAGGIKDAPLVDDDFDFDEFLAFYEITGQQHGDWFIPDECPVKGEQHPKSPETGFFWDGSSLGWHDFVTSCDGSNMSIGQLIKFMNDKKGEGYQGVIWPHNPIEDDLEEVGIEMLENASGPAQSNLGEWMQGTPLSPKPWEPQLDAHGGWVETPAEQRHGAFIKARLAANRKRAEEREKQDAAEAEEMEAEEAAAEVKHSNSITLFQAKKGPAGKETHLISLTGHLASSVTPMPIVWIWEQRFPAGKLALLNGPQGGGKSMLFIDIIAHVSTGANWPDGAKNTMGPRKVLLASTEDDEADTIIPRLIAAGANLANVTILDKVEIEELSKNQGIETSRGKVKSVLLDLKAHTKLIKGLLHKYPDVALIMLDPITAFLGVDETKDKETRPVLESLVKACEGTMCTLIGIIHSNKMTKGSAGEKVKGGSSMLGVPRTAWAVGRDPEDKDQRYMALIKGNVLKKETGLRFTVENRVVDAARGIEAGVVVWGDELEQDANEMLAASRRGANEPVGRGGKMHAAKKLILSLLADGPMKSTSVYDRGEKDEISGDTMKTAAKGLMGEMGLLRKQKADGWWMALPTHRALLFKELTVVPDAQFDDVEAM